MKFQNAIFVSILGVASSFFSSIAIAIPILEAVNTYSDQWNGNTNKYPGPIAVDNLGNVYTSPKASGSFISLNQSLDLLGQAASIYGGKVWGLSVLPNGDFIGTFSPLHGYNLPAHLAGQHQIVRLNSLYQIQDSFGATYGNGSNALHNPTGVATDSFGNVYVADTSNNRIVKLDADLNYVGSFAINNPNAIEVRGSTVYATSYDGTLAVLDLDLNDTGLGKAGAFSFGVQDIAVDSAGRVWAGVLSGIEMLGVDYTLGATFTNSNLGLSGFIGGIAFDGNDNLFSTHAGGVSQFSMREATVSEPTPLILFSIAISMLIITRRGALSIRRTNWLR